MIISVAQLIGDVVGLSNSRFTDSLSVINSYANNDKAMRVRINLYDVWDAPVAKDTNGATNAHVCDRNLGLSVVIV